MSPQRKVVLLRSGLFLLIGGLLFWALKNAPLSEILLTIQRLHPWQLAVLVLLNLAIYLLITLRWWIIVRAEAKGVPFMPLLATRLSVFGVSYFTFGPQVGGEPLQVLALQRRYGLSYTRATASVLMDKLLEFLINFLLLAVGLTAILQTGFFLEDRSKMAGALAILLVLIVWPPVHILLIMKRIYPLTLLVGSLPFLSTNKQLLRFLRACEWLAGTFCRRHLPDLIGAIAASLLAGLGMLVEYALMLSFLGLRLPFWSIIAGWTAGWLSFLVPLPGGLGALEASQVFALGVFGATATTAISLTLLMRARDLLIGGLGLLLAGSGFSITKANKSNLL
jgi:uncharacterized protein (TIRG00374 family)